MILKICNEKSISQMRLAILMTNTDESAFAQSWPLNGEKFSALIRDIEQVGELPEGAETVSRGPDCQPAGFSKGNHVFTTQYYPKMCDGFIAALIEEMAEYVGPNVTEAARPVIGLQFAGVGFDHLQQERVPATIAMTS